MFIQIRDELRDVGYNVWMDVDHMDENMPHARIDAVENAAVFIACMSHKYKQGQTNRTGQPYLIILLYSFVIISNFAISMGVQS